MKGSRVQDHKTGNPFRMRTGPAHADGTAPIMDNQYAFVDLKVLEQGCQIINMVLQPIGVGLRFIRQTTAKMIGDYTAMGAF